MRYFLCKPPLPTELPEWIVSTEYFCLEDDPAGCVIVVIFNDRNEGWLRAVSQTDGVQVLIELGFQNARMGSFSI